MTISYLTIWLSNLLVISTASGCGDVKWNIFQQNLSEAPHVRIIVHRHTAMCRVRSVAMKRVLALLVASPLVARRTRGARVAATSGNPILPGDHPDPSIELFNGAYDVYTTASGGSTDAPGRHSTRGAPPTYQGSTPASCWTAPRSAGPPPTPARGRRTWCTATGSTTSTPRSPRRLRLRVRLARRPVPRQGLPARQGQLLQRRRGDRPDGLRRRRRPGVPVLRRLRRRRPRWASSGSTPTWSPSAAR